MASFRSPSPRGPDSSPARRSHAPFLSLKAALLVAAAPPCSATASRRATHPWDPMLGYSTNFICRLYRVNGHFHARNFPALRHLFFFLTTFACSFLPGSQFTMAQQAPRTPARGGVAELSSVGPQRHEGSLFIADDNVDLRYGTQRLRADHAEYNDQTNQAYVRGHVQYDHENEHLEADEAHYNVG